MDGQRPSISKKGVGGLHWSCLRRLRGSAHQLAMANRHHSIPMPNRQLQHNTGGTDPESTTIEIPFLDTAAVVPSTVDKVHAGIYIMCTGSPRAGNTRYDKWKARHAVHCTNCICDIKFLSYYLLKRRCIHVASIYSGRCVQ